MKKNHHHSQRFELIRIIQNNLEVCTGTVSCVSRLPPVSFYRYMFWERVEAGSGSLGVASSESAAGSGRLRACGC